LQRLVDEYKSTSAAFDSTGKKKEEQKPIQKRTSR
jgi:hypothetical protein